MKKIELGKFLIKLIAFNLVAILIFLFLKEQINSNAVNCILIITFSIITNFVIVGFLLKKKYCLKAEVSEIKKKFYISTFLLTIILAVYAFTNYYIFKANKCIFVPENDLIKYSQETFNILRQNSKYRINFMQERTSALNNWATQKYGENSINSRDKYKKDATEQDIKDLENSVKKTELEIDNQLMERRISWILIVLFYMISAFASVTVLMRMKFWKEMLQNQ